MSEVNPTERGSLMKVQILQLNFDGQGSVREFVSYPQTKQQLSEKLDAIRLGYNLRSTLVYVDGREVAL